MLRPRAPPTDPTHHAAWVSTLGVGADADFLFDGGWWDVTVLAVDGGEGEAVGGGGGDVANGGASVAGGADMPEGVFGSGGSGDDTDPRPRKMAKLEGGGGMPTEGAPATMDASRVVENGMPRGMDAAVGDGSLTPGIENGILRGGLDVRTLGVKAEIPEGGAAPVAPSRFLVRTREHVELWASPQALRPPLVWADNEWRAREPGTTSAPVSEEQAGVIAQEAAALRDGAPMPPPAPPEHPAPAPFSPVPAVPVTCLPVPFAPVPLSARLTTPADAGPAHTAQFKPIALAAGAACIPTPDVPPPACKGGAGDRGAGRGLAAPGCAPASPLPTSVASLSTPAAAGGGEPFTAGQAGAEPLIPGGRILGASGGVWGGASPLSPDGAGGSAIGATSPTSHPGPAHAAPGAAAVGSMRHTALRVLCSGGLGRDELVSQVQQAATAEGLKFDASRRAIVTMLSRELKKPLPAWGLGDAGVYALTTAGEAALVHARGGRGGAEAAPAEAGGAAAAAVTAAVGLANGLGAEASTELLFSPAPAAGVPPRVVPVGVASRLAGVPSGNVGESVGGGVPGGALMGGVPVSGAAAIPPQVRIAPALVGGGGAAAEATDAD